MTCEIGSVGVVGPTPIPLPGFSIPFSPITIPAPGFELPEGFPETIIDFINSLSIDWPGALTISPNLDDLTSSILKALASIFNQIAPFLSLYNFFLALLNMILCIIEVLCALPNPFATARAVVRLIKKCLPAFLNLFPWIALLAMILALIQLLLALIEYIIAKLLQLIEDLLRNLQVMADGLSFSDGDSTAAAVVKIASILCMLENLMAVFTALAAIFAIIQALSSIAGRSVCAGSKTGKGDDSGCCNDDVCPPFIVENPNGIPGSTGTLTYLKPIHDIGLAFGDPEFIRQESWQFVNSNLEEEINKQFKQIITRQKGPTDFYGNTGFEYGDIFWPEGQEFSKDTTLRRAPYTLDLLFESFDPRAFNPDDLLGARDFIIKDVIVNVKPYIGVYNYLNGTDNSNTTGTLKLVGGLVYEINELGEEIPYLINNRQATLETFIYMDLGLQKPPTDDKYEINNITFNLKINHAALINYGLIVYGCIPTIRQELDLANSVNGDVSALINKVGNVVPNITGAQQKFKEAVDKLRTDIKQDAVEEFQTTTLGILDDLRGESEDIFIKVFTEAVNPFGSSFTLNPDIQFINTPIKAEIIFKDKNNVDITRNMPETVANEIIKAININVDFGTITNIGYSNDKFIALIESSSGGKGTASVSFNGNILSKVNNLETLGEPTNVENISLEYAFIGTSALNPEAAIQDPTLVDIDTFGGGSGINSGVGLPTGTPGSQEGIDITPTTEGDGTGTGGQGRIGIDGGASTGTGTDSTGIEEKVRRDPGDTSNG